MCIRDRVGNLHHLLLALSESNINVDYVYLSFNRNSGLPVLIFHTEGTYEAVSYTHLISKVTYANYITFF